MPRAPVAGREIRRRSRNGCWNCKARKVKCGEEKPRCSNCDRLDEDCDYKIRLSWGGRPLKKKLAQQNAENGGDPNGDDQSQFIPGAGQFSINPHFPAPQTFVQASNNNGTMRKPPVPRAGTGKKTSMSTYQTVFAVGETSLPPPPPVMNTNTTLPQQTNGVHHHHQVDPRLSISGPRPMTAENAQPVRRTQTTTQQINVTSPTQQHGNYGWNQGRHSSISTTISTGSTATYGEEKPIKQEQAEQSPYYANYSPYQRHTSPPTNAEAYSPPASTVSSSPEFPPYAQPHNSPPQKAFRQPPPIMTSPPHKKLRLGQSTSPTQDPPQSPFIYGRHNYPGAMGSMSGSIGETLSYSGPPVTTAGMNGFADLHHSMAPMDAMVTSSMAIPTTAAPRRVSVEELISMPQTTESYAVTRSPTRFTNSTLDASRFSEIIDDSDDDDIEDIPRSNPQYGGYGSDYQYSIPRPLIPLPRLLADNKKNRMYFDHYIKYTARLLVPHDCRENPFKSVLPQMAIGTDHLMNLLLAYSASHRARLLKRPEPAERIGRFIDETVRSLASAIKRPEAATSDASLATAIMLASYHIVSPNPWQGLTWQEHLAAARKIVISRGGASAMHSTDTVSYFLVRWFAYLDLIGSLCGREIEVPLFSGKYWTNDFESEDDQSENVVDCFFGFTSNCVRLLAQIGELARKCELERRSQRQVVFNNRGFLEHNGQQWHPSGEILEEADRLNQALRESRMRSICRCQHDQRMTMNVYGHILSDATEQDELLATNDAYHWGAQIHLFRRVLNYPNTNPAVQNAVNEVVESMTKVSLGGAAENCLLFPIFVAGCEASTYTHRDYIFRRMQEVEKTGLTQFKQARRLMERVWTMQRPWWEMIDGEFIG